MIARWRLHDARCSASISNYDGANAFSATNREAIEQAKAETFAADDKQNADTATSMGTVAVPATGECITL